MPVDPLTVAAVLRMLALELVALPLPDPIDYSPAAHAMRLRGLATLVATGDRADLAEALRHALGGAEAHGYLAGLPDGTPFADLARIWALALAAIERLASQQASGAPVATVPPEARLELRWPTIRPAERGAPS